MLWNNMIFFMFGWIIPLNKWQSTCMCIPPIKLCTDLCFIINQLSIVYHLPFQQEQDWRSWATNKDTFFVMKICHHKHAKKTRKYAFSWDLTEKIQSLLSRRLIFYETNIWTFWPSYLWVIWNIMSTWWITVSKSPIK